MQSQKQQNHFCSFPRQAIHYHGNPSLCPDLSPWRSWSWTVLWRPSRPSRINTQKRCPFHYRELEWKSRTSRNTWNNRQIWPWSTEWSRAKANRLLPRECTGHSKHPLPTTQEQTLHLDITRWSTLNSGWELLNRPWPFLVNVCWAVLCWVSLSCLPLCDPRDCHPPSSSVIGDPPGKNTAVGGHALL